MIKKKYLGTKNMEVINLLQYVLMLYLTVKNELKNLENFIFLHFNLYSLSNLYDKMESHDAKPG